MINLGASTMQDFALGDNLVERIDLGDTIIFDPYTTLTGTLPLSFNSRVAGSLKNYRVYGAENGAGVQTINLLDVNAKDTANGYVSDAYLTYQGAETESDSYDISEYIPILADTDYSIIARKINSPGCCFYDATKQFISGIRYSNLRPRNFTTPNEAAYLRMTITRYQSVASPEDMLLLGNYSTLPDFEPYGYKVPLTLTSGQNSDDYTVYIGGSQLGTNEYTDYAEQKVYKDVSGVLTPTDPPTPLPAINAYKGENTLSSTETVGDVTVKGRISPVYGYTVTQAAYDQLTPESGKYYAITSTATGEKIWAVKELTQAEYDQLTPVENTLYIIMNNGAVSNVMYVNTAADVLYIGSTKVWSANHMPEWMHSGIEELLESTSFVSDNYVDIAYVFTTPTANRDQAYFRVCATSDIVTRLEKSANYYSVFQNPYSSSYRGFYTYDFYYKTETNEWYLAGTTSAQDRGKTENVNTSYSHKAIIQNTFTTFTNGTGETNWEDYR